MFFPEEVCLLGLLLLPASTASFLAPTLRFDHLTTTTATKMGLQNASQTKSLLAILAAGVSAWFAWRKWKALQHLPPGKLFMWPLIGESVRYIADPLKFVEAWGFFVS